MVPDRPLPAGKQRSMSDEFRKIEIATNLCSVAQRRDLKILEAMSGSLAQRGVSKQVEVHYKAPTAFLDSVGSLGVMTH